MCANLFLYPLLWETVAENKYFLYNKRKHIKRRKKHMESNKEFIECVKTALTEMGIPYKEGDVPENQSSLVKLYNYKTLPLTVDLTQVDKVDSEMGIVVQNADSTVDDGVYIFTVLHSGQAGFIVIMPGTVSRAPLIRKVTGDIVTAVTGLDLPPLMPFDMVEITAHMLAGTFMRMMMEACRIPAEYEQAFLRLYMPKFLANVGLYFVGATRDDGSPMVYEEIANMEPMMIWNSIQKGTGSNENNNTGETENSTESEEVEDRTKTAEDGSETEEKVENKD